MNSLWYDLNFVKDSFKFLFLENKKIFCDLNFLSLPFYFGKNKKFLRYFRFESSIINYTKLKNSSSFYLIFKLHSTASLKVRADNLFELSSLSFSTIFKSKKYYGYLLESGLTLGNNFFSPKTLNYYVGNSSSISSFNDYFSVNSTDFHFLKETGFPSFFSDALHYFSLFYNRFHRKYQNSSFDIDLFISGYVTDSRKIFSNSFWDVCPKFFIIDTKMNLRSFFINSNLTSSGKYFSYFFLGHFIKKIVYKLNSLNIRSLFKTSIYNGYFDFILNSFINKLDDFFFFNFNKLVFLNFFYKFLNSFGFSNQFLVFLGDSALLLLNKVFVFWSFYYFLNKILVLNDFFIFFFRYFFVILMNLFFVKVFDYYSSFKFLEKNKASRLYSKLVSFSLVKLSKKIYSTKALLKITFKKHAILLFDYFNFSANSNLTKIYFSSKRISPQAHYSNLIHLKVRNFLIRFKNIFLFFFRRNFFFDDLLNSSLLHFRFFVSNFFFKTKLFRFKKRLWKHYIFLNKKFLNKLFFFYRRKIFHRKPRYLKNLLYLFQLYKKNRLVSCLNWKLHKNFDFNLTSIKRKSFGINLFNLKPTSKVSFVTFGKLLPKHSLLSEDKVLFFLLLLFCLNIKSISIYNNSSFKIKSQNFLIKKRFIRFYSTQVFNNSIEASYLGANLDLFCVTFFKNISLEITQTLCWSAENFASFSKVSPVYFFYFFCYFSLINSLWYRWCSKSLFSLSNFSIFFSSFTDVRFFVYISLLLGRSYTNNFNSFFKFKRRFVYKFSDFMLKVDFFTFMFIGEYVEYFRIFKYNEYIMSNLHLEVGDYKSLFFLQPYPKLHILRSYLKLKEFSLFHFYNIYKIYFIFSSTNNLNKTLIYKSFTNFGFIKFFYVYFRLKNVLWAFTRFFYGYFVSSILFYAYKSLLVLPVLFELQSFPVETFFGIIDDLNFFSKFYDVSPETSMVGLFYFELKSKFFFDPSVSNQFFLDQLISLVNQSSPISHHKLCNPFFYNLSRLLVLDYIDGLFFDSMLEFQNYRLLKFLDLVLFWLRWGYLSFVQLPDNYKDSCYSDFFFYFKYTLDFLLWDLYNFSSSGKYSFLLFDIGFLFSKFDFDFRIAYLNRTVNFFLIFFFSVMLDYNDRVISAQNAKGTLIISKPFFAKFNSISIFFLVYFFIRDILLNVVFIYSSFLYLFNHSWKIFSLYISFLLQFNHVSFVLCRFFYFFTFKKFVVNLEDDNYFSYNVYA